MQEFRQRQCATVLEDRAVALMPRVKIDGTKSTHLPSNYDVTKILKSDYLRNAKSRKTFTNKTLHRNQKRQVFLTRQLCNIDTGTCRLSGLPCCISPSARNSSRQVALKNLRRVNLRAMWSGLRRSIKSKVALTCRNPNTVSTTHQGHKPNYSQLKNSKSLIFYRFPR